jgi:hypothetical protein
MIFLPENILGAISQPLNPKNFFQFFYLRVDHGPFTELGELMSEKIR